MPSTSCGWRSARLPRISPPRNQRARTPLPWPWAGRRDPRHFEDGALGIGKVLKDKKTEHGVKGFAAKWKGFRGRHLEMQTAVRRRFPGKRHVAFDAIHSHNVDG